jgi:hypothetical protein
MTRNEYRPVIAAAAAAIIIIIIIIIYYYILNLKICAMGSFQRPRYICENNIKKNVNEVE